MNLHRKPALGITLICLLAAPPLWGQTQTAPSPADKADDAATDTDQQAAVIEVKGKVEFAPLGTDPLDTEAWKPVTKDMKLGVDTQIRTGLRSRCVLMFGDAPDQTVISLRRATLAGISDYQRTQTEQRVRIGLGYGAVRGGSSEGTLRSDVVIDSPVATLAKRGTEGFQIEVEPISGHFCILLAHQGLVEALAKATGKRKLVRPGEYVTPENIARMWVTQAVFDRAVKFFEVPAMSPTDVAFMAQHTTGLSNLAPNGSDLAPPLRGGGIPGPDAIPLAQVGLLLEALDMLVIERPATGIPRPEGNFGLGSTFNVLVPLARRR